MVKQINTYLLEIDFPIENLLGSNKDWIINQFYKDQDKSIDSLNVLTPNNDLTLPIIREFEEIVNQYFFNIPTYNNLFLQLKSNEGNVEALYSRTKIYTYIQKNGYKEPVFHNHIHNSYLTSVTYLNIPKVGGEIGFFLGDHILKIKPKPNKIYFFPSWVYHAPYPHEDDIERICLNIDYESAIRISPKLGDNWW
tara:strand:- start:66 stop:650 length:585 start_codon:yes stop_codon:yes gene_type:complete